MNKTFPALLFLLIMGCTTTDQFIVPEPQSLTRIPSSADMIYTSMNHLISNPACLEEGRVLKQRFITDPDCNAYIYGSQNKQVFILDIESGNESQVTNTECVHISAQAVNQSFIMTNAMCEDTNGDGKISASVGGSNDENHLYLMNLETQAMTCLTCNTGLSSINNPDYSKVNQKIVFSATIGGWGNNHLYTLTLEGSLEQLTSDYEYLEFDCSWSEDATLIVMSRLPRQDYPFTIPSQVWLMNSDATGLAQITNGGPNPQNETGNVYPIGTDADPDLSPDNNKIVFSRHRTDLENTPIGVWELIIININTGEETILDSSYANMIPEWKQDGILFIRQQTSTDPMNVKQGIYLYNEGFTELQEYPYNVFPLGATSISWI